MTPKRLLVVGSSVIVLALGWLSVFGPLDASARARSSAGFLLATSTTKDFFVRIATPIVLNATVVHGVDGDTFLARLDGETRDVYVRFLGINTPESVKQNWPVECFGKEASAFTASLTKGKRVELLADPQADNVDKYGRILRNIFLADGTDLNASLVRTGYAYAYLGFPQNRQRKGRITAWQKEARAAGRGLWNKKTCDGKK